MRSLRSRNPDEGMTFLPRNGMVLTFDILFELYHWSERTEISRLMRTCRTMFAQGLRVIGRDCISVTPGNVTSFCHFFLKSGIQPRHRLLRELDIEFGSKKLDNNILYLAQLLVLGVNVKKITMRGRVLSSQVSLAKLIPKAPAVEELSLVRWNEHAHHTLAKIRGPVRKMTVDFHGGPETVIGNYVDFLDHLCPSIQPILEELDVNWVKWSDTHTDLSLPKVHTLRIRNSIGNLVTPLISAFPQVKRLIIHSRKDLEYGYPIRSIDRSVRSTNASAQVQSGSFTALDYAHFHFHDLFILAPSCMIRTLHVDCPGTMKRLDYWHAAMRSVQAKNLHLGIWKEEVFARLSEALDRVRTRVVGLHLDITLNKWTISVRDTFRAILFAAKTMTALTHLNVDFKWRTSSDGEDQDTRISALLETNSEAFVRRLLKKVPTLKYVELRTSLKKDDHTTLGTVWEIGAEADGRPVTQLSEEEGAKVMDWDRE